MIELSKIQAPSLKLYEFNYLFNKAINQYINKVYNVYDINLQTTDDLRVLKATAFLHPEKVKTYIAEESKATEGETNSATYLGKTELGGLRQVRTASSYLSKSHSSISSLRGANYEVFLPIDYLHMLNCVCIYYVAKLKDCWDAGSYIEIPANRLTADSWSQIITDIYNRPSPMRPYYYIHNENLNEYVPTNPYKASNSQNGGKDLAGTGTDMGDIYTVTTSSAKTENWGETNGITSVTYTDDNTLKSNFLRTFKLGGGEDAPEVSLVEKPTAMRFGNTSNVRCEIRYGKVVSVLLMICPPLW